jgi:putative acetyltransferase
LIRKYLESDKHNFISLYIQSNVEGQNYLSPEFWKADAQEVMEKHMQQSKTWLYEHEGKIVGAISVSGDEIAGLIVSSSYWRKGIGSSLIKHVKDYKLKLHLKVFKKNTRALNFYQKNGFKIRTTGTCQLTNLEEYEMYWAA